MHDRTGWLRGRAGEHKIKNRTYKNLVEFTRQCATCEQPFSIFVTEKIASGHADSNSFGLKNCPEHRRTPIRPDNGPEMDKLRMANQVMREELEGLYARDKELFAENQVLKARLAQHEGVMFLNEATGERQGAVNSVTLNASSLEDALVAVRTDPALTFPWEL